MKIIIINNEIIYKKIINPKINTENINNDMSKLNSHNSLKNISERNFNDEINEPSKLLKARVRMIKNIKVNYTILILI